MWSRIQTTAISLALGSYQSPTGKRELIRVTSCTFEHLHLHIAPATSCIVRRCTSITGSWWWHFWHNSVDCKWIVSRRQLLGIMSCTTLYRGEFILSDIDALYIFAYTVKLTVLGWFSGFWCEGSVLLSASTPACRHRICSFLLWYSVAHTSVLENMCVNYWVVLVIILKSAGCER